MKNLFILGNGFDITHDLLTHYSDFRDFLETISGGKISYMPITHFGSDGDFVLNKAETAAFIISLIDNTVKEADWKDFEHALAELDYSYVFEDFRMKMAIDDEDDDEMYRTLYVREDIARDLAISVLEVKPLFREWIDSVEIKADTQDRFIKLFKDDDLFFTFNYTKTLEEIYGVNEKKICHIHGLQGEEIVLGHGESVSPYEESNIENFDVQDTLKDLFNDLKKDVKKCLSKHFNFFNTLSKEKFSNIYSMGFSFSPVDIYYIQYICKCIDTSNITWHLAEFDEQHGTSKKYEQIIRSCGFKGTFGDLIPEPLNVK